MKFVCGLVESLPITLAYFEIKVETQCEKYTQRYKFVYKITKKILGILW